MTLNPKTRQHLKARAHHLKPVILLGQNGLTEAVLRETDAALLAHELIKVKFAHPDREERKNVFAEICTKLNADCVSTIGNIAIIYRKEEAK